MDYLHTKERDTFHDFPPHLTSSLPPLAQRILSTQRHKPRVRLTTDMKNGKVLKRIVKCRIADLNVLSPQTAFDWRVSVSLEVPLQAEEDGVEDGVEVVGGKEGKDAKEGAGGKDGKDAVVKVEKGLAVLVGSPNGPERNKDRISYRCLAGKFTVDLTQVTAYEVRPPGVFHGYRRETDETGGSRMRRRNMSWR